MYNQRYRSMCARHEGAKHPDDGGNTHLWNVGLL
jgi:hypothetical protein